MNDFGVVWLAGSRFSLREKTSFRVAKGDYGRKPSWKIVHGVEPHPPFSTFPRLRFLSPLPRRVRVGERQFGSAMGSKTWMNANTCLAKVFIAPGRGWGVENLVLGATCVHVSFVAQQGSIRYERRPRYSDKHNFTARYRNEKAQDASTIFGVSRSSFQHPRLGVNHD